MKTLFLLLFSFFPLTSFASTVILIHGANFSAKSWDWVKDDLIQNHLEVFVPELYTPQEHLNLDEVSTRLCNELQKYDVPVILVGHSQGGAIITEASAKCRSRVQSLVYVAAVIPRPGEGVFDSLSDTDNQYYNTCGFLNAQTNDYDLKDAESCSKVFMQDASKNQASYFFKTMVSEPAEIGNSKADYSLETWSPIPKYYVQTQNDLIISLPTQNRIIAGLNFKQVFLLDSSHSPFIRLHDELSKIISEVAEK